MLNILFLEPWCHLPALFLHSYCKWSKRHSYTYHICVLVCLGEIQPGAEDLEIQVHMYLKWP